MDLGELSNTEEIKVEILPPDMLKARSYPAILSGALTGLALVILILVILVVIKCSPDVIWVDCRNCINRTDC